MKKMTKWFFVVLVLLLGIPAIVWAQQSQNSITITVNGVSFEMILVQGGMFTIGATNEQDGDTDDESFTQEVTLSTYYIG